MDAKEIYDTYNDMAEMDAFEAFNSSDVDVDDITQALGRDVAQCYVNWIYASLK